MKRLCVVGLGYIGLPTAALFARAGLEVVGVDTDVDRIRTLREGQTPFSEKGLEGLVTEVVRAGKLSFATSVPPSDAFVVAVATPLTHEGAPDTSALESASRSIARVLTQGNLVIIESTVSPKTVLNVVAPLLEIESGLSRGSGFRLAYCPERAIPGDTLREVVENDRLVGGIDPLSTTTAVKLYEQMVTGEVLATDLVTAEITKLAENTFRDVNIALANELARICEEVGANVWDVIGLANRHPRVNLHLPGPGVGGHCLPKDSVFLAAAAPQAASLIVEGRRINNAQPTRIVDRALSLLEEAHIPPPAKVTIMGVAYRGGVEDTRETPAAPIVHGLQRAGIHAVVCDPYVQQFEVPVSPIEEAVSGSDLLVFVTDHAEYRTLLPDQMLKGMRTPLVLDARNVVDHVLWRQAGFVVSALGEGTQ